MTLGLDVLCFLVQKSAYYKEKSIYTQCLHAQYTYKKVLYIYCSKVKKNLYYSCKEEVKNTKRKELAS